MDIQLRAKRGTRKLRATKAGMQLMHPLVIVSYYGGLGLLCMMHFHPIFLLSALIILFVQVKLSGASKQLYAWRWPYTFMALTILIWNPIFSHRGDRVLFYMKETPIVLESIIYGFTMMLLVLCVLVMFLSYNVLMGSLKFLYVFSALSPRIAVMTAMAVRFVPYLRRRLNVIIDVQRTRGVSLREGSIVSRVRNGARLLQISLVWSLEEAMHTADALAAKGYGSGPRSTYHNYRFDHGDFATLLVISVLIMMCVTGWLYGYGVMNIYPTLDERIMDNKLEWLQLFLFLCYMMLPIIVEGKERLQWRS